MMICFLITIRLEKRLSLSTSCPQFGQTENVSLLYTWNSNIYTVWSLLSLNTVLLNSSSLQNDAKNVGPLEKELQKKGSFVILEVSTFIHQDGRKKATT